MSRRHGWTLIAMGMGLLAPLGWRVGMECRWTVRPPSCATQTSAPSGQPAVPQPTPPASQPAAEMTPQESAKLCLAAGEALEKKGYTAEAVRQYENARTSDPQLEVRVAPPGRPVRSARRRHAAPSLNICVPSTNSPATRSFSTTWAISIIATTARRTRRCGLRNAVAVDPNCRCAWINLGQVLAKQGDWEESYQAFARVLRPAEAYSNLGVLLAKQGRTAEARDALQKAVALDPTLKQAAGVLERPAQHARSPAAGPDAHSVVSCRPSPLLSRLRGSSHERCLLRRCAPPRHRPRRRPHGRRAPPPLDRPCRARIVRR